MLLDAMKCDCGSTFVRCLQ